MKVRPADVRVATRVFGLLREHPVCYSCRRHILSRHFASAAAVDAIRETSSSQNPSLNVVSAPAPAPVYHIRAGVVLSRPPQITRDLTPFEKAFYFYQKRLNERLALPFTKYFYLKKGTPADLEWKRKVKARLTAARDIGIFNPYKTEGWNDELLLEAKESEPENQIEALIKDMETSAPVDGDIIDTVKKETIERPMSRTTEADRTNDDTSLDRLLQRTLYLLVKENNGSWRFPNAIVPRGEHLHNAAERILFEAAGKNMNTWIVGNAPIGFFRQEYREPVMNPAKNTEALGEKVFFMKARIMAGQVDLSSNALGVSEFKWLAKDEIAKFVSEKYWSMTQNMLTDR